jgi:hypothetical protein
LKFRKNPETSVIHYTLPETSKMASANKYVKKTDRVVLNVKKEFMDKLEENLTCFQCKKVTRNPTVSWCSAHHLMCNACYYLLKGRHARKVQCGTDCKLESKPALSPFVANMLEEITPKCKFAHRGCDVIEFQKEKLKVHEADCRYIGISCPFLHCDDKNVTWMGLDDHLEANHGDLKKIDKAKSKDFILLTDQGSVWIPQKLTFGNVSFGEKHFGGFHFFTEVHHDAASQARYFWIYTPDSPDMADHFSYLIKIIGENGMELTFKGKVYSLDETKEAVMTKKAVLVLSDVQVKRLQVDGQINFKISLYSDGRELNFF